MHPEAIILERSFFSDFARTLYVFEPQSIDALYQTGKRVIIAFWHARQLMMPLTYRGAQAHILISQHQDGEIIARIVERFGFKAIRGSSTRGGVEALREMIRLGRSGVDLVVTPDGPKGPAQVAKMGVIQLARASGLPIVPLTFGCSKKNTLVPRNADEQTLEAARLELETVLNRLTEQAEDAVRRET